MPTKSGHRMRLGEAIAITVTDILVVCGFVGGVVLFYQAFHAGPGAEVALTLGAIAAAIIPLPLSMIVHHHFIRSRAIDATDEQELSPPS